MPSLSQQQQQRLAQTQSISPQMLQSLQLLQTPAIDLHALIQTQLETNPALEEITDDDNSTNPSDNDTDSDTGNSTNNDTTPAAPPDPDAQQKHQRLLDNLTTQPTLSEHLHTQARLIENSPDTALALAHLIDTLDPRGLLDDTPEQIATDLNLPLATIQTAVSQLQQLDPPGIGASTIQNSLQLQLAAREHPSTLATQILADHYDLLLKKNIPALADKLHSTDTAIRDAITEISTLDPNPARHFSTDTAPIVEPDLLLAADGTLTLEKTHIPRLRISENCTNLLAQPNLTDTEKTYLTQHIRDAKSLIDSLSQREQTLLKITRATLAAQPTFLAHGLSQLRPLTLAQIAADTQLHETTIGRAISHKHIKTPLGLFPLRSLFSTGYSTNNNNNNSDDTGTSSNSDTTAIAATSIKELIADLVARESPGSPLSDSDLQRQLHQRGINIARRTIAKYRTQLKIPPQSSRK